MKICIKAWAWVGIEDRIGIGPGSNYNEGPKLGIGPGSIFRARDRIGIEILGIDPSLGVCMYYCVFRSNHNYLFDDLVRTNGSSNRLRKGLNKKGKKVKLKT